MLHNVLILTSKIMIKEEESHKKRNESIPKNNEWIEVLKRNMQEEAKEKTIQEETQKACIRELLQ